MERWHNRHPPELLAAYGTVEAIPRRSARWAAPCVWQLTLDGKREEARLYKYKQLATLATDVPLPEKLPELRWRGAHEERYRALEDALGELPRPGRFQRQ